MDAIITTLHVIVCIFLVAVVLLQRGKGAQVGAVFGGGAGATMFGGRGAGNFLTKLTSGAAAVYMITSLSLSYLGISGAGQRLFDEGDVPAPAAAEKSVFEEVGKVPAAEEGTPPAPAAEPGATPAPAAEAAGNAPEAAGSAPEAGASAPEAGASAPEAAGSAPEAGADDAPAAPPAESPAG
jgi:preprotein translocase subunit SecG